MRVLLPKQNYINVSKSSAVYKHKLVLSGSQAITIKTVKCQFIFDLSLSFMVVSIGLVHGEYFVVAIKIFVTLGLIANFNFSWAIISALLFVCVSGLGLLPCWLLVVIAIAKWQK